MAYSRKIMNAFVFDLQWAEVLSDAPAEVSRDVIAAVVRYAQTGARIPLKPQAGTAFGLISKQMDYNAEQYSIVRSDELERLRLAEGRLAEMETQLQRANERLLQVLERMTEPDSPSCEHNDVPEETLSEKRRRAAYVGLRKRYAAKEEGENQDAEICEYSLTKLAKASKTPNKTLANLAKPSKSVTGMQNEADSLSSVRISSSIYNSLLLLKTRAHIRVGDGEMLARFFSQDKALARQTLMMQIGMKPEDEAQLFDLAAAVLAEWAMREQEHEDYNSWANHLIAQIRIKFNSQSKTKANERTYDHRPSNGADAKRQRDEDFANYVASQLASGAVQSPIRDS